MKKAIYVRIDGDGFPYSDEGDKGEVEKQPHFIIAEADLPTKEQVYDLFMEWCYQPGCSGEQVDFAMRVLTQMGLCREGE